MAHRGHNAGIFPLTGCAAAMWTFTKLPWALFLQTDRTTDFHILWVSTQPYGRVCHQHCETMVTGYFQLTADKASLLVKYQHHNLVLVIFAELYKLLT